MPIRVALSWLAVHEAWESAFPSLPITLQPPHASLFSQWLTSTPQDSYNEPTREDGDDSSFGSWFRLLRVVEAATVDILEPLGIAWALRAVWGDDAFESGGGSDTLLLLVLILLLTLVLRVRANLRAQVEREGGEPTAEEGESDHEGEER